MKAAVVASLATALVAMAMPPAYPIYSKRVSGGGGNGPTDTQILQYALTLENLEKVF